MYAITFLNLFSKVLCKKISDDNLWSMVSHLLEGLADYQSHSSSGSCVVLNGIVKTRVSTLTEQVITSMLIVLVTRTLVALYIFPFTYTNYIRVCK